MVNILVLIRKKLLLESIVQTFKDLRSIKDQGNQLKILNKRRLSHNEYSVLVEAEAANFDTKFKTNRKRPLRIVYQQEVFKDNDTDSNT